MGKPNKHGVDENGFIIESGFFGELGEAFEPEPDPIEDEPESENCGIILKYEFRRKNSSG